MITRKEIDVMCRLSYSGYAVHGKSCNKFKLQFDIDSLNALDINVSTIDMFKPFNLFGTDDYFFEVKVYEQNNLYKSFRFHNGHYAKLCNHNWIDCEKDDWDSLFYGYNDHKRAIRYGSGYRSPLQRMIQIDNLHLDECAFNF